MKIKLATLGFAAILSASGLFQPTPAQYDGYTVTKTYYRPVVRRVVERPVVVRQRIVERPVVVRERAVVVRERPVVVQRFHRHLLHLKAPLVNFDLF